MNKTFRDGKNEMYLANHRAAVNNLCMASFGENMRKRAQDLGLSDAEVARRVEISPRRYSHYVNGERQPDYELLLKICGVLQTTPNQILGFDDGAADSEKLNEDVAAIIAGVGGLSETKLRALREIVEGMAQPQPHQEKQ
ncbi:MULTISPECIES: helix-turn-helix transcriptional regulator [unclassified Azospirillum]|uniref:helix-turn-helix domain-containing protein n=1 Tax=unclassified Azospirillum TaxID=2630922 RepID=UPI000D65E507|nr:MULTISPECIES: helix-turn-helix transcriptional regulator [unclassified Azospirillum]